MVAMPSLLLLSPLSATTAHAAGGATADLPTWRACARCYLALCTFVHSSYLPPSAIALRFARCVLPCAPLSAAQIVSGNGSFSTTIPAAIACRSTSATVAPPFPSLDRPSAPQFLFPG